MSYSCIFIGYFGSRDSGFLEPLGDGFYTDYFDKTFTIDQVKKSRLNTFFSIIDESYEEEEALSIVEQVNSKFPNSNFIFVGYKWKNLIERMQENRDLINTPVTIPSYYLDDRDVFYLKNLINSFAISQRRIQANIYDFEDKLEYSKYYFNESIKVKRNSFRISFSFKVILQDDDAFGGSETVEGVDISRVGLSFLVNKINSKSDYVEIGTVIERITIVIDSFKEGFEIEIENPEILYLKRNEDGSYKSGVSFKNISVEDKRELNAFFDLIEGKFIVHDIQDGLFLKAD